jgi:hypothetical protein
VANRNPYKARMARWAKQWPVPIEALQAQAYGALQVALEDVAVEDAEQRRKSLHVYFTALATFAKLLEGAEVAALTQRLDALEAEALAEEASNGHDPRRR